MKLYKLLNRLVLSLIFSSLIFSQFTLSHSSLDFGNVMVGGSYTQNIIIYSNAAQTFTINPPAYFEINDQNFSMESGENKTLQVTFIPPFAMETSGFLIVNSDAPASDAVQLLGVGVNDLEGSVSGLLSSQYSPYNVTGNLVIEEGNTLIIEPGVDLIFSAAASGVIVFGNLVAHGSPEQKKTRTISHSI